jgi:hypothetical protein
MLERVETLHEMITTEEILNNQALEDALKNKTQNKINAPAIAKRHNRGVVKNKFIEKFQSLVDKNKERSPTKSWFSDAWRLILLVCFSFILFAIISEIKIRVHQEVNELTLVINECSRQYIINSCEDRVPLTEAQCLEWEKCMMRDPNSVYYTEIVMSMVASILRSFFDHLKLNTFGMIALGAVFIYLLRFK